MKGSASKQANILDLQTKMEVLVTTKMLPLSVKTMPVFIYMQ